MRNVALNRLGSVLPGLTCCICLDALFLQIKVSPLYLYRTYCYSAIYICHGYAWGATTLTYLYEQLGDASYFNTKQMGSYATLLQV